jgi:hypothetical protein
VVGDVDGDQEPEIVVSYKGVSKDGFRVYEKDGTPNKVMPKKHLMLDRGGVPAIADIDLDGRNEIIIIGNDGETTVPGYFDRVWVFDLKGPKPHGAILWGQFGGNAAHQGRYPVPEL